jgi:hypothetical protein
MSSSSVIGTSTDSVTIRRTQPSDAEACGKICYEVFTTLNQHYNFPPDFPSPTVAIEVLSSMFTHPGVLLRGSGTCREDCG